MVKCHYIVLCMWVKCTLVCFAFAANDHDYDGPRLNPYIWNQGNINDLIAPISVQALNNCYN